MRDVLLVHDEDEQEFGEVYKGLCKLTTIHLIFVLLDAFFRSLSTNLNWSEPFFEDSSVAIVRM